MRYAYQELPFYRERFDKASFAPDTDKVKTLADFPRVPIFTKKEVLETLGQKKVFKRGWKSSIPPEMGFCA